MKPLRISLAMNWMNDGSVANYVGDHAVAESWAKYLQRREDVDFVTVCGPRTPYALMIGIDVCIHFWPWPYSFVYGAKNLLYLQNAFGPEFHPQGTVGVFNAVKDGFDGHIFTSEKLRQNCGPQETAGTVIPFAADPEIFTYHPNEKFAHPVSFVGSDIRGDVANERYLAPAIPHGLVIYGGPWRDPKFQACHRGRLSAEDLPKVYSSSRVCLNVTHPEHVKNGTVNSRIYEILACGGSVLSDQAPKGLDDCCFSDDKDGWDGYWADLLAMFSHDTPSPLLAIECRRKAILANHTYEKRMDDLMTYLKEIL